MPQSVKDRILHIMHYHETAGHPGGRLHFYTLRQIYYWLSMAVDAYMTAQTCADCAKARIKLRKRYSKMKLFPASAPLEYVAIDIQGELPRTRRKNRYLLVVSNRFTKLVRTVPLNKITAAAVAEALTRHWAFVYGPPVYLLSDSGSQFLSKFFCLSAPFCG